MKDQALDSGTIGIFDSGIGGLVVLKELRERLPSCPFVYYGDTARLPYGEKPAHLIQQYACENADFLLQQGATAIVIACNSASSCATELLRQRYAIPIFDAISPTVISAAAATRSGNIAIIGTPATVRSGAYQKALQAIDSSFKVDAYATPLFVPLIEEKLHEHTAASLIAQHYLNPIIDSKADTLILGCTHYTLIKELAQGLLPDNVIIVDSAVCCAEQLCQGINKEHSAKGDVQLHFSAQMLHWQSMIDYLVAT